MAGTARAWVVRSCDALEHVLRFAGGAIFLAFMATVVFQVVFRNFFRANAFIWTTELATFLFVWSVFLGSAVAVRHHRHYALEVFPRRWTRAQGLMRWTSLAGVAIGAAVFFEAGIAFLDVAGRRVAIQLGLSQVWFYLAIPVSAAAMLVFVAERLLLAALPADDASAHSPADASKPPPTGAAG